MAQLLPFTAPRYYQTPTPMRSGALAPLPYLAPSGMQFAVFQQAPAYSGRTASKRMVAKAALIAAALLAITPAVAAAFWPSRSDQTTLRTVDLHGPILGFTQSRDRIQVRLVPASDTKHAERTQVIVRDSDGDTLAIPLKHGQTWATAKLPASIADATKLDITVE
jgi:hypothetical protein